MVQYHRRFSICNSATVQKGQVSQQICMFGVDRELRGHKPSFLLSPTPNPCSAIAGYDAHVPEQRPRTGKAMLQFSPKVECSVPKSSTATTHHSMHSPDTKGCQPSHRPSCNKSVLSICIQCPWAGMFPI